MNASASASAKASAIASAKASKNRLLCASCKGEPLCMQTCLDCRGSGYKACTDWPWCDHSLEAHADQRFSASNPPTPLTPPTIIAMPCSCASHNIADVNCDKCGGLGRRAYLTNGIGGSYVYYCCDSPRHVWGQKCKRKRYHFPNSERIESIGLQKMISFSLTGKIRAPPRRAATVSRAPRRGASASEKLLPAATPTSRTSQ